MNFSQLNQAVKFGTEQERAAFEQAIDENPLESTNHLVYADWLEENGEGEEAAFRRSMGEWVGSRTGQMSLIHSPLANAPWSAGVPLRDGDGILPRGVNSDYVEWVDGRGLVSHPHINAAQAPAHVALMGSQGQRYFWKSYRDLEDAFRRAFMKSPPKTNN